MTIATDWDNRLARHFGILYTYDEDSQRLALAGGAPIGEVTGTGTWELPMPTLDRDRPGRRREIRRCTPRLA